MSITTDTEASTLEIPGDGVTLAADSFGDPTNPPVVLLHGGGQTRHSWRRTGADLAAAGWYAVAVDQRGHGESGWSADSRYSLTRFANDIVTVVEYLGMQPVLVGASLGGAASSDGRLFWRWDPELLASSMERPILRNTLMDTSRLAAAAAGLRAPTLLVRGGKSDVLGVDEVRYFLDPVPHAEFAAVDGAHHMVAGDDNAVFGALLGDFLERRIRTRLAQFMA